MSADHIARCYRWFLSQMRYPLKLLFVCLLMVMAFTLYRDQSARLCHCPDSQQSQGNFPLRDVTMGVTANVVTTTKVPATPIASSKGFAGRSRPITASASGSVANTSGGRSTTISASGSVKNTRFYKTVGLDQPTVVVLSLLHNSEPHLEDFKFLVKSFTYPHELISVVFGEDGSKDGTVLKAKQMLNSLESEFRRVDFHHFDLGGEHQWDLPVGADPKHRASVQKERRRHLALARNMLLANGLRDEDWVLWIDSDIIKTPRDIIERMIATEKDIVAPRCVYKPSKDQELLYDRNTWQDTEASRKYKADPGVLFLEGYGEQRPPKLDMDQLKGHAGDLVEVDSVGGCVLLIKALHHKQGLVFPPYIYKHYIETEGLSKIAQAMGLKLWAMPRLTVYHYHSGTDPAFYKSKAKG